ncbi:hypothetical protein EDB84DRAFT_1267709, partial [Lactarius hengduanensis]
VTTRTRPLTPVPLTAFVLRFSDLAEIEEGCREDSEQRAGRTIDWISARISSRRAKWIEDWQRMQASATEVRQCVEGDYIPSKFEGWNHPVAIVYAVSTMLSKPLQTLAQLRTRPLQFRSWVDTTHLRYSLIIHPENSPLTNKECVVCLRLFMPFMKCALQCRQKAVCVT